MGYHGDNIDVEAYAKSMNSELINRLHSDSDTSFGEVLAGKETRTDYFFFFIFLSFSGNSDFRSLSVLIILSLTASYK